jgi:hypothetical protein
VKAQSLDDEVVRLALLAVQPAALAVSLQVTEDLHKQRENAEVLWSQRLERAAYEVDRSARQYHAVEPENRLVARNLERAWEEKLRIQRELQEQYERYQREQPKTLTPREREQIQQLAKDIPALWHSPSTTDADRKAILREIIDHVEVNAEGASEWVEAWVHWAGGSKTYTRFQRPIASTKQLSNGEKILERLKSLLEAKVSATQIAEQLTAEGLKTPRGNVFNESRVRMLMLRCGLTSKRLQNKKVVAKLAKNEWSISDVVRQTGISYGRIQRWISAGQLEARKSLDGRWIVNASQKRLRELMTHAK